MAKMKIPTSNYAGDTDFHINAMRDVVLGDTIRFDKPIMIGIYPHERFSKFQRIDGKVVYHGNAEKLISDSLPKVAWITIQLDDGGKLRVHEKVLYRNPVYRQPWTDEASRPVSYRMILKRRSAEVEATAVARKAAKPDISVLIAWNPERWTEIKAVTPGHIRREQESRFKFEAEIALGYRTQWKPPAQQADENAEQASMPDEPAQ